MVLILSKIIFLSIAAAIFSLGMVVFLQNRKGYLNRLFFLCTIGIAYRAVCEGEMRGAESFFEAAFWANVSFLRPFVLALFLHCMLYYTGFWQSMNRYIAYTLVYLPAAVFSGTFLLSYDKREMLVRTDYGWVFSNAFPSAAVQIHLLWAVCVILSTATVIWIYQTRAAGDERKKLRIFSVILTVVALTSIIIALLKRFHMIDLYMVNGAIVLMFALILGFLVWRYRILITPALAANEILSSMEDGVLIIGNNGRVVQANKAALAMIGYREEALYKKKAGEVLPADALSLPVGEASKNGKQLIAQFESVITNSAGDALPVHCAKSAVKTKSGSVLGLVILCKDLTQRNEIERELQKARKLETFERLVKTIAHDFNNLLGSVSVSLSLFDSDDTLPADSKNDLRSANQAALLAADLMKQFGSFFNESSMVKTPCDIAQIIREAAGIVKCGARIQFRIGFLGALPPVYGIRQQLTQVFLNLFINARQAMDNSGSIIVSGRSSSVQNDVTVVIRDTGRGMTKEVMDRIYEPNFTTKKGGKGLGLAIVSSIIKSHNGTISVSSAEGAGTTFTITLPASASVPTFADESRENGGITAAFSA
jgi:PAS domain S-box-containing protein